MNDIQLQAFSNDVHLLAESLLDSEGMTLIDIECKREPKGWILRVFMDKPEGVTVEDCALISRQLRDILDAKGAFDAPYRLEVSSPGLDRPLKRPEHYIYFEGRQVVIKTKHEVEGRKYLRGVLSGFSGDEVKLEVAGQLVAVPYEMIAEARLDWGSS